MLYHKPKHVVLFSGGVGSWAAAKRVAERHGTEGLVLLFTDTKTEDEDLYRFLPEAAANVGGTFVDDSDGRDIWEVFDDNNMMGGTRADMCSRELKRERATKWVKENCDSETSTVYVGIDWSEDHRFRRMKRFWSPYKVSAPMTEPPYMTKDDVLSWLRSEGIEPPRLYALGFKHNNCGGFCVKAGHGQFAHLLRTLPDRYAYHEEKERAFRERVGKDVAIMRDRRGGVAKPLTMEALRKRVEAQQPIDELDWGACACVDPSEEELA
jgi:3'-phosphoadenosine 5'-phosphosulfate sulfotransferase (PAPS reductase)/FAD synthetase